MTAALTASDQRALATIVQAFAHEAPGIPSAVVQSTVLEVANTQIARTRVAKQLRDDPEVLTRGDSLALPSLNRLIRTLRERGYTGIEIPRCSDCDRDILLPHRDGRGGRRCSSCNRRHTTPPCTRCGRILPSGYRVLAGDPYCAGCWRRDPRTFADCVECGQHRPIGRKKDGAAICDRCYIPPTKTCTRCHNQRRVAVSQKHVVLCEGCYTNLRQRVRECASCGRHRICPRWVPGGAICGECAGDDTLGRCIDCGANDRRLNGLRCIVCTAPDMLRTVISDQHGQPHPGLLSLETYLLADPRRASAVVGWIRRSPMSRVVRQMARGEFPISLEAVATLPATGASGYLAALLIESGTVPPGNFDRLRLEHWERTEFLRLHNPEHRQILHRFAAWVINRAFDDPRLPSGDESMRLTRSRQQLTLTLELLNTIHDLGYDLDTFPQRAYDEWVAIHGRRGYGVTRFMRWAHTQRLTPLHSTYGPRAVAEVTLTDDIRWTWIRRLLSDEGLRLSWRVGGLLALVYGAIGTRIVTIPLDAVDTTQPQVRLALGREPITLPGSLGELVRRQILAERSRDPAQRWLFPGRRPGHHLSTRALKTALARYDIMIGPGRAVAIMTLSRDIAPAILADLLGFSIEGATRWSKLSNRDWADYPRLRLTDQIS